MANSISTIQPVDMRHVLATHTIHQLRALLHCSLDYMLEKTCSSERNGQQGVRIYTKEQKWKRKVRANHAHMNKRKSSSRKDQVFPGTQQQGYNVPLSLVHPIVCEYNRKKGKGGKGFVIFLPPHIEPKKRLMYQSRRSPEK